MSIDIDYDLEFIEDGKTIEVISIALVADNGDEYYAVNRDLSMKRLKANPWLMDNVWPSLPQPHGDTRMTGHSPRLDTSHPAVKPRAQIADEVRQFILSYPGPRRLWADCGAYDHVALCQLWGRMIDLPDGIPMWTHDIQQEIERLGLTDADLPQQEVGHHNALADARHLQTLRRFLQQQDQPKAIAMRRYREGLMDPAAARAALEHGLRYR